MGSRNLVGISIYFAILNRKNFLSATPCEFALKSLIFALKDFAAEFDALSISLECYHGARRM